MRRSYCTKRTELTCSKSTHSDMARSRASASRRDSLQRHYRSVGAPIALDTCIRFQLHWLPVSYRIRFKLCCLVHAIHYGRSPAYLTETVQSVGASRSRSGLRSSSTSSMNYCLPRLRTKFGERAFSYAGPATWNALPDHIRTVADPVKFRQEAQLSPRDREMRRVS